MRRSASLVHCGKVTASGGRGVAEFVKIFVILETCFDPKLLKFSTSPILL